MKKFLVPALLAALALGTAAPVSAGKPGPKATAATAYKLQPQLSTLGWEGKAVTHGHNGTMQFSSGELTVANGLVTSGLVTVDMKTMKATDITDAETQAKFVGHMSGDDFFGADKFPTATFKIVSVTPLNPAGKPMGKSAGKGNGKSNGKEAGKEANNATVAGDMTIKGVTNRISFPAKVGVKDGVAAASGTVVIDRTKYGLKYGSKSFFDSLGDKAINDDFTLSFNVIAKQ